MKIYLVVKRILDLLISVITLLILLPLFLLIVIMIKIDSIGPIFFKQYRIGKNKKKFYILKFRTMKTDAPKDMPTHLLQNPEVFITRLGSFLRKTSLDELPQIINIIKGEMSFIGPRPALWNQFDLIAERDKYGVNDLIPGLTGLAQVNGRDELSLESKVNFDREYTKKMSFLFDVKILFRTIYIVLKRDGVAEGKVNSNIAFDKKEITSKLF